MTSILQCLFDGGGFQIDFSKTETLTNVAKFDVYVEQGTTFTDYPSFDEKGYAILNYAYVQVSKWGTSSITHELVQNKLNFVDFITISNKLDELKTKIVYPGDEEPIEYLKQIISSVYSKVENKKLFDKLKAVAYAKSTCHFEVNGVCISGFETGNVQGSFNVDVIKLISPQELILMEQFILERLKYGDDWGSGLI